MAIELAFSVSGLLEAFSFSQAAKVNSAGDCGDNIGRRYRRIGFSYTIWIVTDLFRSFRGALHIRKQLDIGPTSLGVNDNLRCITLIPATMRNRDIRRIIQSMCMTSEKLSTCEKALASNVDWQDMRIMGAFC